MTAVGSQGRQVRERRCAFCGGAPTAWLRDFGCLILGEDQDGDEVPYHRLCAERANALALEDVA